MIPIPTPSATLSVSTNERLIFTDVAANNNKFWHAEVKGSTLSCEWGRVGDATPQRKSYTYADEETAKKEMAKKVNSKIKKGYTRQRTMGAGIPAVAYVAKVQIKHNNDSETSALIDFLVQRNIHQIEGTTSIRMEAGRLTTPLGPVTEDGLNEAEKLLAKMAKPRADLNDLANQYMRIIPRNVGRGRFDAKTLFGNMRQLEAEQATLDSLRAVVKDLAQKAADDPAQIPVFQTKLDLVDGKDVDWKRIDKMYRASMNRNHQSSNLKLHQVWKMEIETAAKSFEANVGNIKQLWHGTKDANLLSILKNGYVIPKRNSGIAITGRMFGDGIYFSDQSTKSLNYASGYWGGGRSARCFMLMNDVAMGREYIPRSSMSGTCPPGYDSTWAKAGTSGVMNNEMIVYRATQVNPQYLCEFR